MKVVASFELVSSVPEDSNESSKIPRCRRTNRGPAWQIFENTLHLTTCVHKKLQKHHQARAKKQSTSIERKDEVTIILIRLATLSGSEKMARSMSMKRSQEGKSAEAGSMKKSKLDISDLVTDKDADLTICETKDLVKVGIRADVFYSISDPEKCILKINTDELEDLVRETAIATLTNIIRSTALNEIAQSNSVSAGGLAANVASDLQQSNAELAPDTSLKQFANRMETSAPGPGPSAPMAEFFDKTHGESTLH